MKVRFRPTQDGPLKTDRIFEKFTYSIRSTDDDDINLGKPVQQKVQPLKAPNSRNLPSRQRQIIIDDFSSSSSEDDQPVNNEGEEEICAGVGTSMLYPYSGDDTILETPERAPKVARENRKFDYFLSYFFRNEMS